LPPKEKEDGKKFAGEVLELVNKKTHIFARNRELEHPTGKVNNIEVLSNPSKTGLKEKTRRVFIEPHVSHL
jgi:hypothetical protein